MAKKQIADKGAPLPAVLAAGKNKSFLETPGHAQGVRAVLPVLTIRGGRPGPLAVITAAIHGREINAIAAIERAFTAIDPADVTGTVVFLPVQNPIGVRARMQDYPVEEGRYRTLLGQGHDAVRAWQGPRQDTYLRQILSTVWDTYVRHADVSLDLHAWSGVSLCLAWGHKDYRTLVRGFGLPQHQIALDFKGGESNQAQAHAHGIPLIIAELVPQNTICRESVLYGERGILNTLKIAGLLKGKPVLPPVQCEFDSNHMETVIRTPVEGLCVSDFQKGDMVKKGQTVCRVISLETLDTIWSFTAPHDGLLFYVGAAQWGEDHTEHSILFPGQLAGLLKKVDRFVRNR